MTIIGKIKNIEVVEDKGYYYLDIDSEGKDITATVSAKNFNIDTKVGGSITLTGKYIKSLQEDLRLFDVSAIKII